MLQKLLGKETILELYDWRDNSDKTNVSNLLGE